MANDDKNVSLKPKKRGAFFLVVFHGSYLSSIGSDKYINAVRL
jgi:hypothetical protein